MVKGKKCVFFTTKVCPKAVFNHAVAVNLFLWKKGKRSIRMQAAVDLSRVPDFQKIIEASEDLEISISLSKLFTYWSTSCWDFARTPVIKIYPFVLIEHVNQIWSFDGFLRILGSLQYLPLIRDRSMALCQSISSNIYNFLLPKYLCVCGSACFAHSGFKKKK